MRALILLKDGLHYRRDAFEQGVRANGFEVVRDLPNPTPNDLLVIWNRYGHGDNVARNFEAAGARVIVAENGYMGKDWLGKTWYAMSIGHHNGAGRIPFNGPSRWASFGFELAPMRTGGTETILLPQRGIGEKGVAMPIDWIEKTMLQFPQARVRKHPGKNDTGNLIDDCANALCVVTWGSGAGIKCMAAGIPCISNWFRWIGYGGCGILIDNRLAMFERLAWAQWTIEEIKNGEAIHELVRV